MDLSVEISVRDFPPEYILKYSLNFIIVAKVPETIMSILLWKIAGAISSSCFVLLMICSKEIAYIVTFCTMRCY